MCEKINVNIVYDDDDDDKIRSIQMKKDEINIYDIFFTDNDADDDSDDENSAGFCYVFFLFCLNLKLPSV